MKKSFREKRYDMKFAIKKRIESHIEWSNSLGFFGTALYLISAFAFLFLILPMIVDRIREFFNALL